MRLLSIFVFVFVLNIAASSLVQAQGSVENSEWSNLITNKVKANVVLPSNTLGPLQVKANVSLRHSGEVISIMLISSSGSRFVDAAVMKAIQKSSPFPLPRDMAFFEREVVVVWRND